MVEVVQACQVHSHNMVPCACLPVQVELREKYGMYIHVSPDIVVTVCM